MLGRMMDGISAVPNVLQDIEMQSIDMSRKDMYVYDNPVMMW